MNNMFSTCRNCGESILWVRMTGGKNMPVNPHLVNYRKIRGGKERIVTPNGDVVSGELCGPEEAYGVGYISHFATCKEYAKR